MSDYKRLVAYIYAYQKEQKGNNVGFAKIEARNGECRIGIHLRGIYTGTQSPLKAFAFVRRSSGIYGILLGEFRIVNGCLLYTSFIGQCSCEIKTLRGDRTAAERKMPLARPAAGGKFHRRNSL